MTTVTSQDIERSIAENKVRIEFGQAVERLKANRDFQEVFLRGYFEAEAVRLVHLKADPNMQSEERQRSIVAQMDAIGAVKAYLDLQIAWAHHAARENESAQEALEELLAEEADK